jgi:hypothetical protein
MRGDPSVNVGKGWGDVASTTLQPDAFEHSALRVAERCQQGEVSVFAAQPLSF